MGHDKASFRDPSRVIVSGVAPRLCNVFRPALDEIIPDDLMALVRQLDAKLMAIEAASESGGYTVSRVDELETASA